jgi:hypothetical protein
MGLSNKLSSNPRTNKLVRPKKLSGIDPLKKLFPKIVKQEIVLGTQGKSY